MLELRPNCECCDKDLPPEATDACICSYECTFCRSCVDGVLDNVCPNCGGGFCQRPIRPLQAHRPGVSLRDQPASSKRITTPYSKQDIEEFSASINALASEGR